MQQLSNKRTGFTLVELSLSIVFISILSIAIVMVISNAVSAYHRGITLNKVNTAGMDIVDEIRSAIQESPATEVEDLKDVIVKKEAQVQVGNAGAANVPVYGAFCTGKYSFVWNSGYVFSEDVRDRNELGRAVLYVVESEGEPIGGFRLLKVKDSNREACKNVSQPTGSSGEYIFSVSESSAESVVEILADGESNLALYDLSAELPADGGSNLFYSVSFILGTVQGGINIKSAGDYCATPGGYNAAISNFSYCAINKFNFSAQTTGG